MIRSLRAAAASACMLAIAACAGSPVTGGSVATSTGSTTITVESTKLSQLVAKAQGYAKVACGILPAAQSLAGIFAAGNGTIATASELAEIACSALTSQVAYAVEAGAPPLPPRKPRKGATVTGTAVVNGQPVAVTGTVVKETTR